MNWYVPRRKGYGCMTELRRQTSECMFHTTNYDQSRPNRKTTCSRVFTPGLDDVDYFGRIEEIYELNFYGSKPLTPVIFKCDWFDPQETRQTHSNLGIVEI
jgi:hypothetical protein